MLRQLKQVGAHTGLFVLVESTLTQRHQGKTSQIKKQASNGSKQLLLRRRAKQYIATTLIRSTRRMHLYQTATAMHNAGVYIHRRHNKALISVAWFPSLIGNPQIGF